MKRKLLALATIFVLMYGSFSIGYVVNEAKATPATPESGYVKVETKPDIYGLWVATNNERTATGLRPLRLDTRLNDSATAKCSDMDAKNYWDHKDPAGVMSWHFIKEHYGYYSTAGENLALNLNTDEAVTSKWMASPEHRKNILDSRFTDVGYAVCAVTDVDQIPYAYLVVQHFASK